MVVSRMAKHKTEIAIYHLSKSGMRYLVVTVSPDGVIATRSASASATSFFIAHERLHIPGRHQPNLKPDAAGRLQKPWSNLRRTDSLGQVEDGGRNGGSTGFF